MKWQRIHRLVGSTEPLSVVESLFLDSLLFLKVLPSGVRDLLDLGAGAGFPGIPLKIVRPDLELTLVEAKARRASFLSTVTRELRLAGTQVIHARAEALIERPDSRFDAVVMRCAGALDQVLPLAVELLRPGGTAIASGPPVAGSLPCGEWAEVPWGGGKRRFAVFHNQART